MKGEYPSVRYDVYYHFTCIQSICIKTCKNCIRTGYHNFNNNVVYHHVSLIYVVVVAPRNLQITPSQSSYQPGDRIQCSAEGNPEPSYQWTDLANGTVTQGAVLVITDDMVDKSHSFQCTASNQYNNISSTLLQFTVEGINIFITFRSIG